VTIPVSVTGGWTRLAVMPRGASSNAADIVEETDSHAGADGRIIKA
jgi:hypothetical protein